MLKLLRTEDVEMLKAKKLPRFPLVPATVEGGVHDRDGGGAHVGEGMIDREEVVIEVVTDDVAIKMGVAVE